MSIKTQSAKAKGRNLQKHVRDVILKVFGLEEGDVESCSMGASGVDIKMNQKEEVYMTSDEAVAWGFADGVFEGWPEIFNYTQEEILRK